MHIEETINPQVSSLVDKLTGGRYVDLGDKLVFDLSNTGEDEESLDLRIHEISPEVAVTFTGGRVLVESMEDSIKQILSSDEDTANKLTKLVLKALIDLNESDEPEETADLYSSVISEELNVDEDESKELIENYNFETPSFEEAKRRINNVLKK